MHHIHSIAGLFWCRWFPCKAARRATRERDRRLFNAAKAALRAEIAREREALYEIIDNEGAEPGDPLLTNFARNGGTRHGQIRRVRPPIDERGDPAIERNTIPTGEYQRREPRNVYLTEI